ncbi:substrate-binding domain-containing protein [Paracoccus sp. S-4012]|uniref:substrate-binding domain-containing protein n=1 Tax=Paracoccus sp. S-4012 TaxID=2665648 RepID=UPI0012B01760|nr:substrate-binding domain-containing protein [Paracoccus sp. S-4012]MRX52290.1 substrate-binding domain-containing protein [Paracoccus sp. S-4012]
MKAAMIAALVATGVAIPAAQAETIGVALASDTNPFYVAMAKGIQDRLDELGWEARFVTANENVMEQVTGVENLVGQGVDGILIAPIDAVATGRAYEAAAAAGIPIMSVGRQAQSADQTAYIAMDEVGIGEEIGTWLAEKIGGSGDILELAGPSGAETFRNLATGFEKAIAANPDITIVAKKELPLSRESGLKTTEDLLITHPDVKAIYAGNDELALGAVQAVGAMGRTGEIVVTGLNGVPPALAAVESGELALTVSLNPLEWGTLAVDTMAAHLKGEAETERVNVGHTLIFKE